MFKIDWKRKLTSRKLWLALVGMIASYCVLFGATQEQTTKITALITSTATVVGYLVGEGLTDYGYAKEESIYVEEEILGE